EPRRAAEAVGQPVQADRGEQLVPGEHALDVAAAIAPAPPLLDEPAAQPDRRVVERVRDGLRPGALDARVAALVALEPRVVLEQVGLVAVLAGVEQPAGERGERRAEVEGDGHQPDGGLWGGRARRPRGPAA